MWLEESYLAGLINNWWENTLKEGWAGLRLAIKLKILKAKIKDWAKCHFGYVGTVKNNIMNGIHSLDNKEEHCQLIADEVNRRLQLKEMC